MFLMLFRCLVILVSLTSVSLYGGIKGKVDLGATLINVDVLKSGKTEDTLHMRGVKGDATLMLYEGLCVKPGFLFGWGQGRLATGTIAVGYYLPLTDKFKILPNVGITYSYLHARVDMEVGPFTFHDASERFRSSSPFIAMEFCYSITPKWMIMATYQYAWSHTHTKLTHEHNKLVSEKSHSCGPNYTLGVEYYLDDHWAFNFGVGYNISLSKEKHGLRGKGAKLGVAYYF
jgi:opacity protein-like surface antigen